MFESDIRFRDGKLRVRHGRFEYKFVGGEKYSHKYRVWRLTAKPDEVRPENPAAAEAAATAAQSERLVPVHLVCRNDNGQLVEEGRLRVPESALDVSRGGWIGFRHNGHEYTELHPADGFGDFMRHA